MNNEDTISRAALYRQVAKKEELARNRVLDTPTDSPAYMRYMAQLNERTAFKYLVADFPSAQSQVVHSSWEHLGDIGGEEMFGCRACHGVSRKETIYCPNCGAKMDGGEEDAS